MKPTKVTPGFERKDNPELYDLYAKKLPVKNWAGQKSAEEKRFIKSVKKQRKAANA
jgi:hypothetical protein